MKPKNFERETEGGGYAGTAAGGQRDSRRGLGESLMSAPIPDEDPLRKKERMNLRYLELLQTLSGVGLEAAGTASVHACC